jgi:dipeptidyl aminopeptidase/acylaminoacyl peptidase
MPRQDHRLPTTETPPGASPSREERHHVRWEVPEKIETMHVVKLMLLAAISAGVLPLGAGCGDDDGDGLVVEGGGSQAWSPSGDELAVSTRKGFRIIKADGSGVREIKAPPANGAIYEIGVSWTDDDRLLYTSGRGPGGKKGVWATSIGVDGRGLRQVPLGLPLNTSDWSRGRKLVFVSDSRTIVIGRGQVGPAPDLWILDGFGSRPRRVAALPGDEIYPKFSPDGESILFERLARGEQLWTVRSDGSDARPIAAAPVSGSGAWSPDGSQIAVVGRVGRDERTARLWLVPATGGEPVLVADEPAFGGPAWTSDGGWIAFVGPNGAVRRVRPDGSGAETIARYPGDEVFDLLWSPDGEHLALSHFAAPQED